MKRKASDFVVNMDKTESYKRSLLVSSFCVPGNAGRDGKN